MEVGFIEVCHSDSIIGEKGGRDNTGMWLKKVIGHLGKALFYYGEPPTSAGFVPAKLWRNPPPSFFRLLWRLKNLYGGELQRLFCLPKSRPGRERYT
jgi:hypothetical protein